MNRFTDLINFNYVYNSLQLIEISDPDMQPG